MLIPTVAAIVLQVFHYDCFLRGAEVMLRTVDEGNLKTLPVFCLVHLTLDLVIILVVRLSLTQTMQEVFFLYVVS